MAALDRFPRGLIAVQAPLDDFVDRLLLLLPVLMWIAAALITWLLVSRLRGFGIREIRPRREADKIHEEDGDELSLFTE